MIEWGIEEVMSKRDKEYFNAQTLGQDFRCMDSLHAHCEAVDVCSQQSLQQPAMWLLSAKCYASCSVF